MKFSIEKLCKITTEKFSCVEIIYLFGSAKNGEVKSGSDIDIGVFLNTEFLQKNPMVGLEMEIYIQEHLKCSVDVIIMNKANSILRFEILNTGRRVYEINSEIRRLNELYLIKDYFDVKYYQQKRNGYGQ